MTWKGRELWLGNSAIIGWVGQTYVPNVPDKIATPKAWNHDAWLFPADGSSVRMICERAPEAHARAVLVLAAAKEYGSG